MCTEHGEQRRCSAEQMTHATVKIGFTVVRDAARMFYHVLWQVLVAVHGDDFIAAGESPNKLGEASLLHGEDAMNRTS